MPPSRPAAPFLFPFPIILEQILPVPCQMDSYISKAHNSWNEVGKVIWTPKPVMLCFCYCLSGGNTGFLGMFFLQVGCVLQGLCGLCISSWLLLQYELELGAEKSLRWSKHWEVLTVLSWKGLLEHTGSWNGMWTSPLWLYGRRCAWRFLIKGLFAFSLSTPLLGLWVLHPAVGIQAGGCSQPPWTAPGPAGHVHPLPLSLQASLAESCSPTAEH